MILMKMQ